MELARLDDLAVGRLQFHPRDVEGGGFRCPGVDVLPPAVDELLRTVVGDADGLAVTARRVAHRCPVGEAPQGCRERVALRVALHADLCAEPSVLVGIEDDVRHVHCGHDFQPDRAEDAAEEPPVGAPLGIVDALVGGLFRHLHFEGVLLARAQQVGDVVGEAVEGSPVNVPGGLSVDADLRVGHDSVEEELHALPVLRAWRLERVSVGPCLVAGPCPLDGVPASVGIVAEALCLPAARHLNRFPDATVLPLRTEEFPCFRVIDSRAGQVNPFRMRCLCP